jgi:hypothetical protein
MTRTRKRNASRKRRATARRPRRKAAKRSRRSRRRNARGWFTSRGGYKGGKSRTVGKGKRKRRVYSRPKKSTVKARRRRRNNPHRSSRRRTRRNPVNGGRAIFGLNQLAKLPLIGPLFREDVVYTGVGVATGLALIPKFEGMILKATGIAPDLEKGTAGKEWYTKLDDKGQPPVGRRVMDTALPVAVGSAGAMAAYAIRGSGGFARFTRNFSKGVAIAGVGIGIGRLLDWILWPKVPEAIRPPVTPAGAAMTVPPPTLLDYAQASGLPRSLGDYAQASGLPRSLGDYAQARGMSDYATTGHGFDGYGSTNTGHGAGFGAGAFGPGDRQRGESLLEGGGEEAELATMTAEMRTF